MSQEDRITGKDLIAMGYIPGKWFGQAIKEANEKGLRGQALRERLEELKPPPAIEPHENPKPHSYNIEAEDEDERDNVDKVKRTMDEVMKTPTVQGGAIMPDACPAGDIGTIPVGGVVSSEKAIHPGMHSSDICCSVMATYMPPKAFTKEVMDAAQMFTHFGPGGREDQDLPGPMINQLRSNPFFDDKTIELARSHFATQGDGNHFLFVGISEQTGDTVIVTHHGSRGLGARLYKKGMEVANRYRKEISPNTLKQNAWIPYDEEEGQQYWEALQMVREWTKQNHQRIHQLVCLQSKVDPIMRFWNEHNFIFKEGDTFHHAKGATPIEPSFVPDGKEGLRIIPLNMSEPVLVVKGERNEHNRGFAPHGAGRNMSRSEHKRRNEGKTEQQLFEEETKGIDVRFQCGEIDTGELPSAYKNAASVQRQIEGFGLGRVVDRIHPYGCIMAGDWQRNAPWRKNKKKGEDQ